MLVRVVNADVVGPHSLSLTFSDGVRKRVNLRPWLYGPVFGPLRDPERFARIALDGETVTWPDQNADLAPEFLYELEPEAEALPAQPGR
ncbi:MAG: DUF2442 domain-containing protein [Anaerolineae bacterium]